MSFNTWGGFNSWDSQEVTITGSFQLNLNSATQLLSEVGLSSNNNMATDFYCLSELSVSGVVSLDQSTNILVNAMSSVSTESQLNIETSFNGLLSSEEYDPVLTSSIYCIYIENIINLE